MCDACIQPYPEPLLPCTCSWCQDEGSWLQNDANSMSSEMDDNPEMVQIDEQ